MPNDETPRSNTNNGERYERAYHKVFFLNYNFELPAVCQFLLRTNRKFSQSLQEIMSL